MRVLRHPILGDLPDDVNWVKITVDGRDIEAVDGEPVAAAVMASGIRKCRTTSKFHHTRGVFCAIGRCTDCAMTVDGIPNVRTCVARVEPGMIVETQEGLGKWGGIDGL